MIRRLRYWLAVKLVPELVVYAQPTPTGFARATLHMFRFDRRVDPKLVEELGEILSRLDVR